MLILRRQPGESLIIGDQISISILSVDAGGAVSLGINAPRDMLILRSELQQAAQANQDAAQGDSLSLVRALECTLIQSPAAGQVPSEASSGKE